MISVVCAYNNETILNEFLLRGLKDQTVEYELITVDTVKHRFQSAAEALNFGGNGARGKYIMFVHQDVRLVSNSWLENAEEVLDTIPNLGIAGVIGKVEEGSIDSERTKNIIIHGDDMQQIGNHIDSPVKVQTLDELLLIIPKEVFKGFQFDQKVCNHWHLYGVDYCLSAAIEGKSVYVIPFFVIHKSKGASINKPLYSSLSALFTLGLDRTYYKTLNKVLKKHKKKFVRIYTTTGWGKWNTTEPLILQRIKQPFLEVMKYIFRRIKLFYKHKKT